MDEIVKEPIGDASDSSPVAVQITVFLTKAKVEVNQHGTNQLIGWFKDEVSALGAVGEWALMHSALQPGLRKMPPLAVKCEYSEGEPANPIARFVRGTAIKTKTGQRRAVMLPGASQKPWLCV